MTAWQRACEAALHWDEESDKALSRMKTGVKEGGSLRHGGDRRSQRFDIDGEEIVELFNSLEENHE